MGTWWTLTEEQRLRRVSVCAKARAAKKAKANARTHAKELEDRRKATELANPWGDMAKPSLLDRLRRR